MDSLDIDRCITASQEKIRRWNENFENKFYRRQRNTAVAAWWASMPDELKSMVKDTNPDLSKRMEEGDYGTG
jgi:hypothetical protein